MHGTEDDAVLDRSQELFIGFQKRPEAVKIRRWNFQGMGLRAVPGAAHPVAGLALANIDGLPSREIGRVVLGVKGRHRRSGE
jgi:hypothetical protein